MGNDLVDAIVRQIRTALGLQNERSCCPAGNRYFLEVCDMVRVHRGAANTLSNTDTVPANVTSSVDSEFAVKSIQKGNMTAHLVFVKTDCIDWRLGLVKEPPRGEV